MARWLASAYHGPVNRALKAVGYAIEIAALVTVLVVGWMVARTTHHMVIFVIAVAVIAVFNGYAGWSKWRRNAEGS